AMRRACVVGLFTALFVSLGVLFCKKNKMAPVYFSPRRNTTARRPPICVVSITLPRSPVSLSSGDEVPHIFTRKSRPQPGEFLIIGAKRLLQQNRSGADIAFAPQSGQRANML